MRVLKFGGTSITSVGRIRNVCEIIRQAAQNYQVIVVVSALAGVTNQLIDAIEKAIKRDHEWSNIIEKIKERHLNFLKQLASKDYQKEAIIRLDFRLEKLISRLNKIAQQGCCSPALSDSILSTGECLSVPVIVAALQTLAVDAQPVHASELIRTDDSFGEARVDFRITNEQILNKFKDINPDKVPVVTGFIGSGADGQITTLGRNGSDYTATIIGAALKAEQVEIWSDTNGILTADPAILTNAIPLPEITFGEAEALAQVGAGVLHPKTIQPLIQAGVPAVVKNTFQPNFVGTYVKAFNQGEQKSARIVTSFQNAVLFRIEVYQSQPFQNTVQTLLEEYSKEDIFPLLVSEYADDRTVSIAIPKRQLKKANDILNRSFEQCGKIRNIKIEQDISVVAIIGHNIHDNPETTDKAYQFLKKKNLSILACSDGYSPHTTAMAIEDMKTFKAVSILHSNIVLAKQNEEKILTADYQHG
jgi:aspartokinase/homoserine dehydrogenase 1